MPFSDYDAFSIAKQFLTGGRVVSSSVGRKAPSPLVVSFRLVLLTALLVLLTTADFAIAQDAFSDSSYARDQIDPWTGVEEMIVVGSGAADLLTQSTQSVTRFDADFLKATGVDDISDLAGITPNLEIRKSDATSPTFFIRGVGLSDFNANAGGAVAVYQDGVAMNLPALSSASSSTLVA